MVLHSVLKALPVGDNAKIFLGVIVVCGVGALPMLSSALAHNAIRQPSERRPFHATVRKAGVGVVLRCGVLEHRQ